MCTDEDDVVRQRRAAPFGNHVAFDAAGRVQRIVDGEREPYRRLRQETAKKCGVFARNRQHRQRGRRVIAETADVEQPIGLVGWDEQCVRTRRGERPRRPGARDVARLVSVSGKVGDDDRLAPGRSEPRNADVMDPGVDERGLERAAGSRRPAERLHAGAARYRRHDARAGCPTPPSGPERIFLDMDVLEAGGRERAREQIRRRVRLLAAGQRADRWYR